MDHVDREDTEQPGAGGDSSSGEQSEDRAETIAEA